MPNVFAKHAASVAAVQRYVGTAADGSACGPSLRYAGVEMACSASGEAWQQDLERGGFNDRTNRTVVVVETDLAGKVPEPKQTCLLRPNPNLAWLPYRIVGSDLLPGGTLRRLTLECPQEGA